jgi:hypothetical protein
MSARKSMTMRVYLQSSNKRAENLALLDTGATENFINLDYAKYLRLPIKQFDKPRLLLNVDGTENRAGSLKYYTDLSVRTGNKCVNMRFMLSNLGDQKVILGYPWFAAMQPRIDWAKGWIEHDQLPVILRAPNAQCIKFTQ